VGYILLWIETMAVLVLLVAYLTAVGARRRQRRAQVLWAVLPAGLLLLGAVLKAAGIGVLMSYRIITSWWLVYMIAWTVVYAAIAARLIAGGLRRGEDGAPRARAWSAGRLGVAAGAALALTLITFWNVDLAAKTRLAGLRAEAGALAMSAAPPRVPDRQNAALVYQQAFDALGKQERLSEEAQEKLDGWLSPKPGTRLDPTDPDLAAFLEKQQPTLALLRRAAAMPDCYFEHNYAQPSFDMLLPELAPLRRGAALLAFDARVRAARQDARGALEDVGAVFAMAGHLRSEPVVISVLVAASASNIGVAALEDVLATARPKAEDLEVLKLDEPSPYLRSVAQAFRMEQAVVLSFFIVLSEGSDREALSAAHPPQAFFCEPFTSIWRVFLLPDDIMSYRRVMHRYTVLASRPYHETHTDWKQQDADLRLAEVGLFTRMLVPALSSCGKRAAETDAQYRLACTALAAEKYRAKTGQPPARLDALVPDYLDAVPMDPFDGKPLRMAVSQGGILLYSIGPGLKDEGGAPWDSQNHTGNITFRLPAR